MEIEVHLAYLLRVLSKFNLVDNFIRWISLLYAGPCASVITNGIMSPAFIVKRGTRQVCPVSHLVFVLAIQPQAEAIRTDLFVKGIEVGSEQHKMSLYADDVILYLSSPEAFFAREVVISSLVKRLNTLSLRQCILVSKLLCPFSLASFRFHLLGHTHYSIPHWSV